MIKDEFRPIRRDRGQKEWQLDVDKIDYHLACARKCINKIKEMRDRVA